jgi:hypothetical protein
VLQQYKLLFLVSGAMRAHTVPLSVPTGNLRARTPYRLGSYREPSCRFLIRKRGFLRQPSCWMLAKVPGHVPR